MSWTAFVSALVTLLETFKTSIVAGITYLLGKRAGAKDERDKQREQNLEDMAAAERASRNLNHDDSSVRDDPFNRDT